jgi:hypothetical protein
VSKETVDSKVLRRLFDQGIEIPGASNTEYLKVQQLEMGGA